MLTTIGRSMHTRGQNWSKCLWQLAEPSYGPPSHAAWQRRSRRPWRLASSSEATLLPLASMSSLGWPGLHSHANSHLSRSSKQSPSKCGASASANMSCNSQPVLGLRTGPPRFVQFSHRFPISVPGRRQSRSSLVPTEAEPSTTQTSEPGPDTALLKERLRPHPDLVLGKLDNGLNYAILPAVTPPGRFEAHLEIHAGSKDERPDEQGMAHLVEHVTFLGSTKRENLHGTGARSNAYTDFHHTVFHVHAPQKSMAWGQTPLLPKVLEALVDTAFKARFDVDRITKERSAVVAEAQMMNTMEYRVDCALLRSLHRECSLGSRFPIGRVEQVPGWTREQLLSFWQRWYVPANATLFVVGDFDRSVPQIVEMIEKLFGPIPAGQQDLPPDMGPRPAELPDSGPASSSGSNGSSAPSSREFSPVPSLDSLDYLTEQRGKRRRSLSHEYGCGPIPEGQTGTAPITMFRHALLHHFQLTLFSKLPLKPMTLIEDVRTSLGVRVLLGIFSFRFNRRISEPGMPGDVLVDVDHSGTGREGCNVSTLAITCEPRDWQTATQVAIQEARRLQRFGVTQAEADTYRQATLRDNFMASMQADYVPAQEILEFLMETLATRGVFSDNQQFKDFLAALMQTVTIDYLNNLAKSVMSFASHYGHEAECLAEAEADSQTWGWMGPTRCTAIIACIPAFTDSSGLSVGGKAPTARGQSMTTDMHVDPASMQPSLDLDQTDGDIPEGAMRFQVEAQDIADCLSAPSPQLDPLEDVSVPDRLIPEAQLHTMLAERSPQFVPLARAPPHAPMSAGSPTPPADPTTGMVQRRLSNGVRLNYIVTDYEPGSAVMRINALGGRFVEPQEAGPAGAGVIGVGARTISEAGAVGQLTRQQLELFSISQLFHCTVDADDEALYFDCSFTPSENGLRAALETAHLFMQEPTWTQAALDRAKQRWVATHRSNQLSLERGTTERIFRSMFKMERRFQSLEPPEIEALQLPETRKAVMALMHPQNLEVNIVGDFDPQQLEQLSLELLGTLQRDPPVDPAPGRPVQLQQLDAQDRRTIWHLKDSDERADGVIAGTMPHDALLHQGKPGALVLPPFQAPAYATPQQRNMALFTRRSHPLYRDVTFRLLSEVINSRLFRTIRDALNLTYDVTFDVGVSDLYQVAWWSVHVTSKPENIHKAVNASLEVLRNIATMRIMPYELERAKVTVLTKHDADTKNNRYQLQQMSYLQFEEKPRHVPECLRDLTAMYDAIAVPDLYQAYDSMRLGDDAVYTCIGTSGPEPPPAQPLPAMPAEAKVVEASSPAPSTTSGNLQGGAKMSAAEPTSKSAPSTAGAAGASPELFKKLAAALTSFGKQQQQKQQ